MLDLKISEKKERKKRKRKYQLCSRVSVVYYFTSEDKYLGQFQLLFCVALLNITVKASTQEPWGLGICSNLMNSLS